MRLNPLHWRRFVHMFGRLTPGAICLIFLAGGIVLHHVGWPIMVWLVRLKSSDGGPAQQPVRYRYSASLPG